jgi:hypothetical protein
MPAGARVAGVPVVTVGTAGVVGAATAVGRGGAVGATCAGAANAAWQASRPASARARVQRSMSNGFPFVFGCAGGAAGWLSRPGRTRP